MAGTDGSESCLTRHALPGKRLVPPGARDRGVEIKLCSPLLLLLPLFLRLLLLLLFLLLLLPPPFSFFFS